MQKNQNPLDENESGSFGGFDYKPPRPLPNPIVRYAVVIGVGVFAAAVLAFVAIGFLFPQTLSNPKQPQGTTVAVRATQDTLQTQAALTFEAQTTRRPDFSAQTKTALASGQTTQDDKVQQTLDALDAAGTRAAQAQQTLEFAETRAAETRQAEQEEQTRIAIDQSQTRAAGAQQTLDALNAQQTDIAVAEATTTALALIQTRAAKTQQALDALHAEQTQQAIESYHAEQTRQAMESFYAEQTRQAMQAYYAEQTRVAADKTRAAQNSNRLRYWIECDSGGAARIYLYSNTSEWPEVWIYASIGNAKGEGPMSGGDIQPKYVDPYNNKGAKSVDYRITGRFYDGHQETVYVYYRYPSDCSPSRP